MFAQKHLYHSIVSIRDVTIRMWNVRKVHEIKMLKAIAWIWFWGFLIAMDFLCCNYSLLQDFICFVLTLVFVLTYTFLL